MAQGALKLNVFADKMQQLSGTDSSYGLKKVNDENSNSSNISVPKPRAVKHYEVPNLSSMLYEFTNKERDYV